MKETNVFPHQACYFISCCVAGFLPLSPGDSRRAKVRQILFFFFERGSYPFSRNSLALSSIYKDLDIYFRSLVSSNVLTGDFLAVGEGNRDETETE